MKQGTGNEGKTMQDHKPGRREERSHSLFPVPCFLFLLDYGLWSCVVSSSFPVLCFLPFLIPCSLAIQPGPGTFGLTYEAKLDKVHFESYLIETYMQLLYC